jgi:hypothetical protein
MLQSQIARGFFASSDCAFTFICSLHDFSPQDTGAPGALLEAILLAGKSSVNARPRQHPISGTDKMRLLSAICAGNRPADWTRTHPLL